MWSTYKSWRTRRSIWVVTGNSCRSGQDIRHQPESQLSPCQYGREFLAVLLARGGGYANSRRFRRVMMFLLKRSAVREGLPADRQGSGPTGRRSRPAKIARIAPNGLAAEHGHVGSRPSSWPYSSRQERGYVRNRRLRQVIPSAASAIRSLPVAASSPIARADNRAPCLSADTAAAVRSVPQVRSNRYPPVV